MISYRDSFLSFWFTLQFDTGFVSSDKNFFFNFQEDLDCPMSSSVKLATMTDDKVWTRCIMADINMAFPDTLTFMYKSERLLESNSDKIKIIHLDKNEGMDNLVKEEVKEFCERLASDGIPRVKSPISQTAVNRQNRQTG